jgi:signal transduction histidine kinase
LKHGRKEIERATMTTTTAAASPLSDTRWPAAAAREQATDPLRDLLIHDIRTPLAAISGYAQLLLRHTVADSLDMARVTGGLRRIDEAATRVGHLLDELTGVPSLYDADRTGRQREMIDLVHLVKRITEESHAAALGRCRLVVLPAVPDLVGWWNSAALERMLANLIDNALKYNRHYRPVVVSIHRVEGWAVLSVADQGLGIPAAELPRVFERGYRATNVSSHVSGSGLGLAGARQIVAEYGGTISLDSQLGNGTTVTVRLPLGVPTP